MDKEVEKSINSVCLKLGIKYKVGHTIIDNLFKQLRENLKDVDLDDPESFKNFRILGFGLYYSTQDKRDRFNNRYIKAKEKADAKNNL